MVVWVGFARAGGLSLCTKSGGDGGKGVGESTRGGILFFVVVDRGGAIDWVNF